MCLCCSTKCCFIFFNLLFLASGVALITIGVLQYSTYSQMGTFAGSSLSKIAIVLISVGVTVAVVSLLGHVGAFTNNSCMVSCFICILIVMIILEIATGAVFYVFRSRTAILQADSAISNKARGAINEYKVEKRHTINRIQEKFSCCGADSYTDWSKSVGWENHNAVPDSCCVTKTEGCGQDKTNVHKKGCISAIKRFLVKNFLWVGAVCITLGVAEVFGVLVGVCLCLDIKRKSYGSIS
ncbi:CD63 antigen-like [Acanthochromis polyacanthus]|uniref:CD63 antigen-like n=1 Tax=Acanthochromis polyacanthus TaxID=80966 RepID=UPI002234DCC6|nr:CD63 antigen-like [Acanthochromis polyacanthus]XP_051795877.1 CD63 antigen-like [Acanthochromis polyacanthus]